MLRWALGGVRPSKLIVAILKQRALINRRNVREHANRLLRQRLKPICCEALQKYGAENRSPPIRKIMCGSALGPPSSAKAIGRDDARGYQKSFHTWRNFKANLTNRKWREGLKSST